MVRYGADEVFRSSETSVTDEDINMIIARGELKSQQQTEKLQSAVKNLLDLSGKGTFLVPNNKLNGKDEFDYKDFDENKDSLSGHEMFKLLQSDDVSKRNRNAAYFFIIG